MLNSAETSENSPLQATNIRTSPPGPWLMNKKWQSGKIVDEGKSYAIFMWIFAIFWNGISWLVTLFVALPEFRRGERMVLFVLVFPLIGLLLVLAAVSATMRWMKFGRSVLELETMPGCVGGWLAGTIQTSVQIAGDDGIHLTLKCIHRYVTGSGKNRSTHERTLWQEEQRFTGRLPSAKNIGSAIPVAFKIPKDVAPTSGDPGNDILWRLRVTAAMPGADYAVSFEVPVFVTEQQENFAPQAEAVAAKLRPATFTRSKSESNLHVIEEASGRKKFDFPAGRNPKAAMFVTGFFILFAVIGIAIIAFDGPWFFAAFMGLLAAVPLYVAMKMWFQSVQLIVDRHGIERRSRTLIFSRSEQVRVADVASVHYKITTEVGEKAYYTVTLKKKDGRSVWLVSGLVSQDANDLALQIAELLNVIASPEALVLKK